MMTSYFVQKGLSRDDAGGRRVLQHIFTVSWSFKNYLKLEQELFKFVF